MPEEPETPETAPTIRAGDGVVRLRGVVVDAGGVPVPAAPVVVRRKLLRLNAYFPDERRDAELVKGRFEVSDVDPGLYRLVVKPGTGSWGGEGHDLATESAIELPPEGRVELRHEVRRGDRLSIAVEGAAGKLTSADCVVRDSAGGPVSLIYLHGPSMSPSLSKGKNLTEPPLAPGRYQLEIAHREHAPKTVSVLVTAGETTEVAVTLEAR